MQGTIYDGMDQLYRCQDRRNLAGQPGRSLYDHLRDVCASLIRDRTTIESSGGGFLKPTTWQANTDWSGFQKALEDATRDFYADSETRLAMDGVSNMPNNLAFLRGQTMAKTKEVEDMQRKAMSDTVQSIKGTVEGLETDLKVAEFVRDTSATILVAGASVLSAGEVPAALLLHGAWPFLKGVGKYQDTGNVGRAMMESVGTFVVGMVPMGSAGATLAEQKILLYVGSTMDGMLEGVKSVMDGESGKKCSNRPRCVWPAVRYWAPWT